MHMQTKPQVFYDDTHKQALGYQNPFHLKKAQQIQPTLYDGSVIAKEHAVTSVNDDEKTLILEEESRSKILGKQNDSISIEKKIKISPIDYSKLNKIKEDFDLNAQLQEKVFAIIALKNTLRKLKGKNDFNIAVSKPNATVAPGIFKLDLEAFSHEELLVYVSHTCPSSSTPSGKTDSLKAKDSNKPLLTSTGVKPTTSASGSKPSGNIKNNRITRPLHSNQKNKVEDHSRNVKSSLNKKNSISEPISNALVKHSMRNAKFKSMCAIRKKCLFDANHDMCLINHVNDVNMRSKSKSKRNKKRKAWKPTGKVFTDVGYKWKPTGRLFTIVGSSCPLTRITLQKIVHLKETTSKSVETSKPKIKVYSRRPKQLKLIRSSKQAKIVESKTANNSESTHLWGSNATDVPSSSSLVNDSKFMGTVRFGNDQVAKIMGYGDYQQGNVIISRVYYVEGLRHNLVSVRQFCDADLEVAFRKNTCFIRNLEGVDLLSGSRDTNLNTISLDDMLKTSPICLLSKASKTKSWLWHHHLSHLNFGTLKIAKDGLARGIPKLKFQKDHLCSACALGKSKKSSHQPKAEDTNQEKLYLLHMDLCGPMRMESINEKKYILVIVDDYSRFTWVKFLRSKDKAPDAIIKCIKNIQVRLNAIVRNVRTDNGNEFVNQTLHDFYENVGISHQTAVARTPQQNGVVERQN
ncbi:retrovirus-related pol polyprotein from transposon TNT 1-94 [Tanacetum coccineum]